MTLPITHCPACHWGFSRKLRRASEQGWVLCLFGTGENPRVIIIDLRQIENFPLGDTDAIRYVFAQLMAGDRRDGIVHECITTLDVIGVSD